MYSWNKLASYISDTNLSNIDRQLLNLMNPEEKVQSSDQNSIESRNDVQEFKSINERRQDTSANHIFKSKLEW